MSKGNRNNLEGTPDCPNPGQFANQNNKDSLKYNPLNKIGIHTDKEVGRGKKSSSSE